MFFAPWFTFDPAGSSNDPARQHGFTLQGDLGGAADGAREVQIVQSLGGRFDSRPTSNANLVGRAKVYMLACDRARLDYALLDDALAGAFAGRSGTLTLEGRRLRRAVAQRRHGGWPAPDPAFADSGVLERIPLCICFAQLRPLCRPRQKSFGAAA